MAPWGAQAAQPARELRLSLRLRIARCGGKLVRQRAWLRRRVATTNRIYGPHRLRVVAKYDEFSPRRCVLLSRRQRNGLAKHVLPGEVTVLVVQRIRDLDVKSYNLMGVHWRFAGQHWVYLTARASKAVLAHELGHYLGLRHDPKGGNLMTPGPSDPRWRLPIRARPMPFRARLSKQQGRRLRAAVLAMGSLGHSATY